MAAGFSRPRTVHTSHHYLSCTAVLETSFETASDAVTVNDFMPLSNGAL
jgi:hypothetical protein